MGILRHLESIQWDTLAIRHMVVPTPYCVLGRPAGRCDIVPVIKIRN